MKNKLGSSSQPLDVMDDDDLKECNAYEKWKKDALKEEKQIEQLYRLLTDPNMKSVWSTITNLPPNVPHSLKTDPVFCLWSSIARALRDFNFFI